MGLEFSNIKPADPHETSVFLDAREPLKYVGNAHHAENPGELYRSLDVYEDTKSRHFFRLTNRPEVDSSFSKRQPHIQAMLSMMLKGIMPVADVVPIAPRELPNEDDFTVPLEDMTKPENADRRPDYLSYLVPLKDSADTEGADAQKADAFILQELFGDTEHYVSNGFVKNIAVENKRYTLYDFSIANLNPNPIDTERVRKDMERLSPEVRAIIARKLQALEERFSGEAGTALFLAMKKRLKDVGEKDWMLNDIKDDYPRALVERVKSLSF